jgi:hypothetical protein
MTRSRNTERARKGLDWKCEVNPRYTLQYVRQADLTMKGSADLFADRYPDSGCRCSAGSTLRMDDGTAVHWKQRN